MDDQDHSWDVFLEHYEITGQEVGRGGQGIVHLIQDKLTEEQAVAGVKPQQYVAKTVELKKVSSWEEVREMQREATTLQKLNNPGVVGYIGYFEREVESPWNNGEEKTFDLEYILIMPKVDEPTLAEVMEEGSFNLEEVYNLMDQAKEILAYIHSKKVVHSDIKPENWFYNRDTKKLKLADFGLAKDMSKTQTSTRPLAGTRNYLPPDTETTPMCDIYSLGIMGTELAQGKRFEGNIDREDLEKTIDGLRKYSAKFRAELHGMVIRDNFVREKVWDVHEGKYIFTGYNSLPITKKERKAIIRKERNKKALVRVAASGLGTGIYVLANLVKNPDIPIETYMPGAGLWFVGWYSAMTTVGSLSRKLYWTAMEQAIHLITPRIAMGLGKILGKNDSWTQEKYRQIQERAAEKERKFGTRRERMGMLMSGELSEPATQLEENQASSSKKNES